MPANRPHHSCLLFGIVVAIVAHSHGIGAQRVPTAGPPLRVTEEIERIVKSIDGFVGASAQHLQSGTRIAFNSTDPMPMASTFKVAVAGTVLAQVDAGTLTLNQLLAVDPDLVVESDGIAKDFPHPGVLLSVQNLLESMLTQSDNTATDVLVKHVGGPSVITSWLRSIGIADQRVDRDTAGLLRDFYQLPAGPYMKALREALADPRKRAVLDADTPPPNPEFDRDPRDTSTADAMVLLLSKIFRGEVLTARSTETLTQVMLRCMTGANRLPGLLPPHSVVAHKTGTLGGSVNDVGVITLPDKRGEIAIAILMKGSTAPIPARERVIAHVGRLVYDYFLTSVP